MKKNLFFALIAFILFNSSCKTTEVEPTLADQVSGNYEITTITQGFDSIMLPANGYSGEFVVSKLAENQIKLKYALKNNGKIEDSNETDFDLKKDTDGGIVLYIAEFKLGTYKNKSLQLVFEENGEQIAIISNKK